MSTALRVLLKREVTLEDVGALSWREDWNTTSITRKGEIPEREVWVTMDGGTVITFLGDPITGLRYLVIDGKEQEGIRDLVESHLPCWTHQEALEFLSRANGRDEKIHGIYLSSVSAPVQEQQGGLLELFRGMVADPDPDIRHAILVAISYLTSWPTLRVLAAEIEINDPDENVRRDAGYLIEGIESSEEN